MGWNHATTCNLQDVPADATLELKATDGRSDYSDCGTIAVRLGAVDSSKAGAIVISNTLQDIKLSGVDHLAVATESEVYQVVDAGVTAGSKQSVFLDSLYGVMSKLEIFVQIVDKAAKVSMRLTFA